MRVLAAMAAIVAALLTSPGASAQVDSIAIEKIRKSFELSKSDPRSLVPSNRTIVPDGAGRIAMTVELPVNCRLEKLSFLISDLDFADTVLIEKPFKELTTEHYQVKTFCRSRTPCVQWTSSRGTKEGDQCNHAKPIDPSKGTSNSLTHTLFTRSRAEELVTFLKGN